MTLPLPKPTDRARSDALADRIHAEIAHAGGAISFARYMALALYTPALGYYAADHAVFGRSGDFITAPELTPLFARCLIEPWLALRAAQPAANTIAEFGAGSGVFARDMLLALRTIAALPEHYIIIEPSATLRQRQAVLLRAALPDYFDKIRWHDHLPDCFCGLVYANEVLDALPAHCFTIQHGQCMERCVASHHGGFRWQTRAAEPALQQQFALLNKECQFTENYASEIRLTQRHWLSDIAAKIKIGGALFIDYGYGRREYYHPARTHGTLTCFYRHHAHADPLILPGLQDISVHVDFTAVAEDATAAGLHLAGFTSQAAFLLAHHLTEHAAHLTDARAVHTAAEAIKTLTLPTAMGETVKVMGFTTDAALSLTGFELQDRRHDL